MAASIIDLAKQYLTSEVVHKMSGALGEQPEQSGKSNWSRHPNDPWLELSNMASSSGVNRLVDMLKQEPTELSHLGGLDGVFGNLGSILSGGGSADGLVKYGQTLLSAIFGGKISSILDLITKVAGIKSSSVTSLLGMLAPLVMGVIRKELATRGTSAGAVTNLLMSQKDQIAKCAPAGLSNVLGLKSLSDLGAVADSVKSAGIDASREFGRVAIVAANEGSAWLRWAAPLALLAAALLGVLYYYNNGAAQPDNNGAAQPVPETGASTTLLPDGDPGPETTILYTDVSCPEKVWLKTPRFLLVLRLTRKPPLGSRVHEALNVEEGQPVRARLAPTPFFELLEPEVPIQTIEIVPNEDSRPVVFYLMPKKVGTTRLTIDLFRGTEPLRTLTIPIEVTAAEGEYKTLSAGEQPINVSKQVDPPSMVLFITARPKTRTLDFALLRQGGAYYRTFSAVNLERDDAEAYASRLYRTIADLVDKQDPLTKALAQRTLVLTADAVDDKLKRIGYRLWDELVPNDFKEEYGKMRDAWRGQTLLIYSSEPYVPWELMWPYAADDSWKDAGPLCETMLVTRWLCMNDKQIGNEGPPGELRIQAIAVLAPHYNLLPELVGAKHEQAYLAELIKQHQLKDVSPAHATWQLVMDVLEGGSFRLAACCRARKLCR